MLSVDVEDPFEYASQDRRPSGGRRRAHEIYLALHTQEGDTGLVPILRRTPRLQSFCDVAWVEIEAPEN